MTNNEIILYQPDATLSLDVRLENDTVWLTQAQMSELFSRDRSVITRHISNIFKENELDEATNVHFLHIAFSDKPVKLYSLDVIISVGYRVKSIRGTQFRQWANKVLKEFLLRGYSINQRMLDMEARMERRLKDHDRRLDDLTGRVDFFVKTSLPPREGVVYDGQIFDAHLFTSDLVSRAKSKLVLIDNYIDASVLALLDNRNDGVEATIFTGHISPKLALDISRHNSQYPTIAVRETCHPVHDRFLIVDDIVYHIGASIKDLGKKLFAFSQMSVPAEAILDYI